MTESRLNIRSGSLFPWHFQLIAVLILIAAIALLWDKPAIGTVLAMASGFILTAASGTEVDKEKSRYREYMSFYGIFKNGKWKKFSGAEKVFINSAQVRSTMQTAHTNHGATFKNVEYNTYLKLTDGTKIYLISGRKKEKLATTLQKVASFLNIPVQDNTPV